MKRLLFIATFLTTSLTVFCQTKNYTKLVDRLKVQYKNQVAIPKPKDIFINKFNKSIEIEGHEICIDSVKVNYFFDVNAGSSYQNEVKFDCIKGNCIVYNIKTEKVSGLRIAFKTKKACYDFINILSELKELLDN